MIVSVIVSVYVIVSVLSVFVSAIVCVCVCVCVHLGVIILRVYKMHGVNRQTCMCNVCVCVFILSLFC